MFWEVRPNGGGEEGNTGKIIQNKDFFFSSQRQEIIKNISHSHIHQSNQSPCSLTKCVLAVATRDLYGEKRRSTENTRRGAALRLGVDIRPGSRPSPRGGRAPSRARRASPHRWPEPRAPGAAAESPPQNKSTRRRTPSPRLWALGLPVPHPAAPRTRGNVRVPAGTRGPYLPTGAEPNLGEPGKRSASQPRSLSQLGSASRGGSRGRPTPGKPTPPRRNGSSETRYPVPGS